MQSSRECESPAGLGRCALAALLFAVPMCWPLLVTGKVYVFFDTDTYLSVGTRIFELLSDKLERSGEVPLGTSGTGAGTDPREGSFLRSIGYSVFVTALVKLGGPLLVALAQGWIAIFTVLALAPRQTVTAAALVLAVPMALTTLPWFTVFVMPDIFAAVLVAFGAILWRTIDSLSLPHRLLLIALASGASLTHYGNPPLALALFALVLVGRLLQRRLSLAVLVAAAVPVLVGPLANLGASAVVLDSPSAAPKRLPILLARSIEDGPAAWYLAEECASASVLAICDAFDGQVPDDISEFLWSDRGLKSLTNAEIEAVRSEETQILLAAFLAYPAAQTRSLTRNAWRQFHSVGLAKIEPAPALYTDERVPADAFAARIVAVFDVLVDWTTLAGALLLVPLILQDRTRFAPVVIVFAGLAINAAIFGGLSAPDDRYQARVAWILPALALTYLWAELRRGRLRGGVAGVP